MADELDALRGDVAGAKDDPRVTKLREQISNIVKLAHSNEPDDQVRYRELQPKLRALTTELVKLEQGDDGDQPVDLTDAVIEQAGSTWRILAGKAPLAWTFGDRATAEKFLEHLKRDEQQQKDSSK